MRCFGIIGILAGALVSLAAAGAVFAQDYSVKIPKAGGEERQTYHTPLAGWYEDQAEQAWLTKEVVQEVFPGAEQVRDFKGDPKAAEVYRDGILAGYLLITRDIVQSLGFSSQEFTILVGLSMDGTLTGAKVIDHREPIIDLIMLEDLIPSFARQYAGVDIRRTWSVSLTRVGEAGNLDGISSATISAILFNEAIIRAARLVAISRDIRLNDEPTVNMAQFDRVDFETMVEDGSIAHLVVTPGDLVERGVDPGEFAGEPLIVELFAAPVIPPTIGRSLLSDNWYNLFVSGRDPKDLVLGLMAIGPYSLDGKKYLSSGPFERLQLVQGDKTYQLNKSQYRYIGFLHGTDKPDFGEIGLFWIDHEQGIDPLAPWTLRLTVEAETGGSTVFEVPYTLDERYILQPTGIEIANTEQEPIWYSAWRTQQVNLFILGALLVALVGILVAMEPLTRRPRLYTAVRVGFLLVTLGWIGWTIGAQVTIINVLTWIQNLVSGQGLTPFLMDPLIFVLMAFVIVTFVFWGRGIFCGWLCPFGALQELLARLARLLRIPQTELSHKTHRWLWPVKYVLLAGLIGLSFYDMALADWASEIEPFKTAISLYFVRDLQYVAWAVALLLIGLTVERFFCRFLCPLGAFMAVGGQVRIFNFLKRRAECGSPCKLCERKCPIAAITPSGRINMTECFYCLDCQVVYYDEQTCPPLVNAGKRARRLKPAAPGAAPDPQPA